MQEKITDYLQEINILAEKAREIYISKIKTPLEVICEEINEILLEIVKENESDYNLVMGNNSSEKIELFTINSRVKEEDSLQEKIIRNQVFYNFIGQNDEFIEKKLLTEFDDLIGVRFLVSLSCDCESIFKLLSEKHTDLKAKGIEFNNLNSNPETMKNGRKIYRLKGLYKKERASGINPTLFELQIKSKVDSAWADVEHMLFYKNFNFSYIQSTNKAVMNQIGDLLEQTDKLMVKVRSSEESYEEAVEELEFNQYLRKRYVDLVRRYLGSPYLLSEQKDLIFSIFVDYEKSDKTRILGLKDFPKEDNVLSLKIKEGLSDTIFLKNYNKLKRNSIELIFIECIYCEWKAHVEGKYNEIDKEELTKFIRLLIKKSAELYLGDVTDIEVENYSNWLSDIYVEEILTKDGINFEHQWFVFDKKRMEQLAIYWKVRALKLADTIEIESQIMSLDNVFLLFMNCNTDENIFEKMIETDIELEYFTKVSMYLDSMNSTIDEEYSNIQTSKSGKRKGKHCYNHFYGIITKIITERGEE